MKINGEFENVIAPASFIFVLHSVPGIKRNESITRNLYALGRVLFQEILSFLKSSFCFEDYVFTSII